MKPGEVIYGGLWVASAVYVAGYTWTALTGEYAQFPGMSGGGNTDPGSLVPEKKGQRIPLIGSGFLSLPWAKRTVSNIGNALGGNTPTPTQTKAIRGTGRGDSTNYGR